MTLEHRTLTGTATFGAESEEGANRAINPTRWAVVGVESDYRRILGRHHFSELGQGMGTHGHVIV